MSGEYPTFECNPERLNPRYLNYYLKRPSVWAQIAAGSKGLGDRRQRVQPSQFLEHRLPLPSLAEQQRIIAQLDEVETKVGEAKQRRREADAGYEELCRSILLGDADGRGVSTKMSELMTLRDPDVIVRADEAYHFAGVYSFGKGLFRGQRKPGSSFAYERLTRLRANNFVYLKLGAWEGALGVVPPECEGLVVSTEFPVFEVDDARVLPEALDVYFRTPEIWPVLAGNSTGTNMRRRRLNPTDFLKFKMPLPPMETQLRLRQIRQMIEAGRGARAEVLVSLDALRASILDRAFSGVL